MYICEEQPRYDTRTGKQIGTSREVIGWACDYCGKVKMDDGTDHMQMTHYLINEVSGSESTFHEMKMQSPYENIDLYILFDKHREFIYCQNWWDEEVKDDFCEAKLMEEWLTNVNIKNNLFFEKTMMAGAMYVARLRVIKKLLDNGYTPKQLGLELF